MEPYKVTDGKILREPKPVKDIGDVEPNFMYTSERDESRDARERLTEMERAYFDPIY